MMEDQQSIQAYRASILYCIDDPNQAGIEESYRYFEDGLMIVENGHIQRVGHAKDLLLTLPSNQQVVHYKDALITPGFIDIHIHYPQTEMIASHGEQLLDWLTQYTFPTEEKFASNEHANEVAELFLDELLRNGTTSAMVFATVHPSSVDALFQSALARNLRIISGKVMMDRNAPATLTETAQQSYESSKDLIKRWHEKGRLHYAVTPRFAPTSSNDQLALAGQLLTEFPNLYMHTHLAENADEIEWVKELFPKSKHYLDVYDQHNLLGKRSVFAHGIHLCADQCTRLAETNSAIAFCPTSNLFLGSGLFNLPKIERYNINVGMGTDIGAGTSFSMLNTLNEAYKVMQLQDANLTPFKSLYLATLGGARALQLEDKIGTLAPGTEADFIVLDFNCTPLISFRMKQAKSISERLFILMTLGDDRAVRDTYVMGKRAYQR